jgi:rSAM-associated Gly-rich repeat protein
MSHLSRRQLLTGLLGSLAKAAGTVVLARVVLSETAAQGKETSTSAPSETNIQERAAKVAARQEQADEAGRQPQSFVTAAFGRGGFGRGGYGGGGFRRGGFGNGGYGGGFRRGGFGNGGFGGGGFRNGAFRNW